MTKQTEIDRLGALADALTDELLSMSDEALRADTLSLYGSEHPFAQDAAAILLEIGVIERATPPSWESVRDHAVELWRGAFSDLRWLVAAPQPALSQESAARYVGVEIGTDFLLRQAAIIDAKWALGPLQILAAEASDGTLQSIKASFEVDDTQTPSSGRVWIELEDRLGAVERMSFTADSPSAVLEHPRLQGPLTALQLAVSYGSQ